MRVALSCRVGVGCHDLGVCDKVVLDLDLRSFHIRSLLDLHEISLILMTHRRHGLVADSKTIGIDTSSVEMV